jgi:nicotinate phosphoribosyltransferase
MSRFDGRRLPAETFALDADGLRRGFYSDQYFNNMARLLAALAAEGYRFAGDFPRPGLPEASSVEVGDLDVEMQYFTRREPASIACGVDEAVAILRAGAQRPEALSIEAVHDGDRLAPWQPALRVQGRYRDFAATETPVLGALTRRTRIATNVFECFQAARGKPILYFPARFDLYQTQAGDGYAYRIGLERYNHDSGAHTPAVVSTDAQGSWWGQSGSGTVAHSLILCFLGDTAEASVQFARLLPPDVPRVALVDTNNDCVGDSLRTARALFARWRAARAAGNADEAQRYVLYGVRADTAGNVRDVSVPALGDARLDCGVNPRLIHAMRAALDAEGEHVDVPPAERPAARDYFRAIRLVATGGFHAERIAEFERLGVPVDIYGVGSALIRGPANDFTADIVRVRLGGEWVDLSKVGRGRVDNGSLERA